MQKSIPVTVSHKEIQTEDGPRIEFRVEATCPFCGEVVWHGYAPSDEGGQPLPPEGGCLHFKGFYQSGRVTDVDAMFEI